MDLMILHVVTVLFSCPALFTFMHTEVICFFTLLHVCEKSFKIDFSSHRFVVMYLEVCNNYSRFFHVPYITGHFKSLICVVP
jgi:hypothetical protein